MKRCPVCDTVIEVNGMYFTKHDETFCGEATRMRIAHLEAAVKSLNEEIVILRLEHAELSDLLDKQQDEPCERCLRY